jgi:hypothetical protein
MHLYQHILVHDKPLFVPSPFCPVVGVFVLVAVLCCCCVLVVVVLLPLLGCSFGRILVVVVALVGVLLSVGSVALLSYCRSPSSRIQDSAFFSLPLLLSVVSCFWFPRCGFLLFGCSPPLLAVPSRLLDGCPFSRCWLLLSVCLSLPLALVISECLGSFNHPLWTYGPMDVNQLLMVFVFPYVAYN